MTIVTAVRRKESRYLFLEQIMAAYTTDPEMTSCDITPAITLLFDQVIDRFPASVFNGWRSQGVLVLMGPGFGALARYQAHYHGCKLIVTQDAVKIKEGDRVNVDLKKQRWHTGNGLGGPLYMQEIGSKDMAAFLASVSDSPQLQTVVQQVVDFSYDPEVNRL